MNLTEFDSDRVLTEFLTDYLDGNLGRAEKSSFEDYLAQNEEERAFARKAMKGKKALVRFADQIDLSSAAALES